MAKAQSAIDRKGARAPSRQQRTACFCHEASTRYRLTGQLVKGQSGLYIFYANQAGKSGRSWFPGLVLVTDPHGRLVAEHLPTEGMIGTEVSRGALTVVPCARTPVGAAVS